jgi:hypothetical protein
LLVEFYPSSGSLIIDEFLIPGDFADKSRW